MIKNTLRRTGKLPMWWPTGPSPGNFGDILTPLLIKELYGYEGRYVKPPFAQPVLVGCGSIIKRAETGTVVWGSGAISREDTTKRDAIYLAVRGRHTHELLKSRNIECPEIFGDPALLLPRIYSPTISKRFKFGIFAHYVDYEQLKIWYINDPDVLVINVLNHNPLAVVDQLLRCEYIISSSLHGLIAAHAYGLPAVWVKHSDKLVGDDVKFFDHLELVGIEARFMEFYEKIPTGDLSKLDYKYAQPYNINPVAKALKTHLT